MKNVVKCYKDFFDYFNALKTDCVLPSAVGYVTTILEGVHTTNSPNFGFNVFFVLSWYVVRAALNFRTSTQSCIRFMLVSLDQPVTKN